MFPFTRKTQADAVHEVAGLSRTGDEQPMELVSGCRRLCPRWTFISSSVAEIGAGLACAEEHKLTLRGPWPSPKPMTIRVTSVVSCRKEPLSPHPSTRRYLRRLPVCLGGDESLRCQIPHAHHSSNRFVLHEQHGADRESNGGETLCPQIVRPPLPSHQSEIGMAFRRQQQMRDRVCQHSSHYGEQRF